MGIQINQLCNMNMKFAVLLLFVGVTSATWCWQKPEDGYKCYGEKEEGQATNKCCEELKVVVIRRGCWVVDEVRDDFEDCCKNKWNCTGPIMD